MHLSTYLVPVAHLVPVVPVTDNNKFVKRAYPYARLCTFVPLLSITYFLLAFLRYNNVDRGQI